MPAFLQSLTRNQKILIGGLAGAVVLVVVLVVVLSGGGDDGKEAATTTTEATTTTTTEPPPVSPLTGLPNDDDRRERPALIVKVDNTTRALTVQEGLDRADLVFVEQVEGGATRLAAVFQSEDATVGPVRSARTSDIGIASALNRPLLSYSGANIGVLREVRRSPLVDVGIDEGSVTSIYQRNQRGSGLLRYFLPTSDLYDARGDLGATPPQLFQYRAEGEDPNGDPATGVQIGYGGSISTVNRYEWDGTGWARSQNDKVHQMAGGGPRIAPENVVILFTQYRSSGYVDSSGAPSPEAVLEGGGEAWYFTGGRLIRGTWSHPGPNAPFTFTSAIGAPVELTPGQTWIELAPGPGSATVL